MVFWLALVCTWKFETQAEENYEAQAIQAFESKDWESFLALAQWLRRNKSFSSVEREKQIVSLEILTLENLCQNELAEALYLSAERQWKVKPKGFERLGLFLKLKAPEKSLQPRNKWGFLAYNQGKLRWKVKSNQALLLSPERLKLDVKNQCP